MKIMRSFLIAIVTLFLVTGYSSIHMEKTVSSATTNKKITINTVSGFTLELPANWKNNYILKSSKSKKRGSYATFYSKKCYKQKKEGWLFTIMRYKDDSYTDMPSYELVGQWDEYYYVALFPTDVQTEGVTKAAKKQYQKLSKSVEKVVKSVVPYS